MCLDFHPTVSKTVINRDVMFHPQHPHMLAAGLYDGSVVVYNLQVGGDGPVLQATAVTGKHRDTVWEVCWALDDLDSYLNFFSVSEVIQREGESCSV